MYIRQEVIRLFMIFLLLLLHLSHYLSLNSITATKIISMIFGHLDGQIGLFKFTILVYLDSQRCDFSKSTGSKFANIKPKLARIFKVSVYNLGDAKDSPTPNCSEYRCYVVVVIMNPMVVVSGVLLSDYGETSTNGEGNLYPTLFSYKTMLLYGHLSHESDALNQSIFQIRVISLKRRNIADIGCRIAVIPMATGQNVSNDVICKYSQINKAMPCFASLTRKTLYTNFREWKILTTNSDICKIQNPGFSNETYILNSFPKKMCDLMPIKWMAIEAIRDRIFSVQSDVWAYGVTLWEIFSLGSTPYPGIEVNSDFLQLLEDGKRMELPRYGNRELYDILLSCWEAEPSIRPTFAQLADQVGQLLNSEKIGVYVKMNDAYLQMNKDFFSERTDYLEMLASPNFANKRQSADQVVNNEYMLMRGITETGNNSQPTGYLPMGSARGSAAAVDTSVDIFSPRQLNDNQQRFFSNEEDADMAEKIVDGENGYMNIPKNEKDLIRFSTSL
ncbi:unnamed protein product, partial [Meganyctiphanes norvegica]